MNNKDIDICIDSICYFVRIYKKQNKKPIDIFIDSNYKKYYQEISMEKIITKVKSDESIVEEWIMFTLDKRWTPAWGLFEKENGKWFVSLIEKTGKPSYELIYTDRILACAHMIKFEMEGLRLGEK